MERKCCVLDLPEEVLVHIFSYFVSSEGVSELLKIRFVCKKWKEASEYSSLWTNVDDKRLSKNELLHLSKYGHLRHTTNLNLEYLGKRLTKNIPKILERCCNLKSLDVSNSIATTKLIHCIAEKCPNLERLKMKHMNFEAAVPSIDPIISSCGRNLVHLSLYNNYYGRSHSLLSMVPKECHFLEELHVICNIAPVGFHIHKFQHGCPKLRVLELGACEFICSRVHDFHLSDGFYNLESFIANVPEDCCGISDKALHLILQKSKLLRVLELANCNVTCDGLSKIPTGMLENLNLSNTPALRSGDLSSIICNCRFSLKKLNLHGMVNEIQLYETLSMLWDLNFDPLLEVLDLSSTSISPSIIHGVLCKLKCLRYLNVESCRALPRGSKRIYRTPDEIKVLIDIILETLTPANVPYICHSGRVFRTTAVRKRYQNL